MKLSQLKDVLAVANKRSFRAAARHLHMSQPAISRSIHELERDLGILLFHRHARGAMQRFEIIDVEGAQLGIAGIWEHRKDGPNGLPLLSFSMLTINADGHPLMQRFHKPDDEKCMLVILRPDQYDEWLTCAAEDAPDFFTRYPADRLVAQPSPKPSMKPTQATLPDL